MLLILTRPMFAFKKMLFEIAFYLTSPLLTLPTYLLPDSGSIRETHLVVRPKVRGNVAHVTF